MSAARQAGQNRIIIIGVIHAVHNKCKGKGYNKIKHAVIIHIVIHAVQVSQKFFFGFFFFLKFFCAFVISSATRATDGDKKTKSKGYKIIYI